MSDQNTAITETGLGRMLHQFSGSTNLRKLATSYLDQAQAFEDAIWPLLGERDLSSATGHRLDGVGQLLGMPRAGRSDADYRLALQAEIYVLTSNGLLEELLTLLQAIVQMGTADYEAAEYYPKTVYLRPTDHVLTQDPDFVANTLQRAASAATKILFVYALQPDAGLFTLSSQGAVVETSSTLGLATVPDYVADWHYESLGTVLSGLISGEFRFNNADPLLATEMYVHDEDDSTTDQSTWLSGLSGSILQVRQSSNTVQVHVTGVTDNTGTFTLDIAVQDSIGTLSDYVLTGFYDYDDGGSLSGAAPE